MEPTHFESLYPDTSREKEIAKILSFIAKGNACQVISLAGTGRSNLLGLLSYNRNVRTKHLGDNQKWYHFVLLNFSEVKGRQLYDVVKYIFLSLADSLRDRQLMEEHDRIHAIFKEHYSFNDEIVLFQGLKEAVYYLTIEKELTIILLCDRFEEYVPVVTSDFFSQLRVLRNQAKYRFSIVFSLNRPLEELLEPSLMSDYHEFLAGHSVFLPIMDKSGLAFRLSYLEKSAHKTLPKSMLEKILQLTKGHGKLTRLAAEEILSDNIVLNEIKELSHFLLSQKPIQGTLLEIWRAFTPAEQTYLVSLAKHDKDELPSTFIQDLGLVNDNLLQIPLFEQYIQQEFIEKKEEAAPITYNATNKTIIKGNFTISDTLTSSEYKLLKYLVENAEKIVGREEIIAAVWHNTQSTAGVTDQAVDQLIFRLRRKIEDNPNEPTHLQTVKGRGFKFAP